MKVIDRRQFLQMGLATTAGVVAASMLPVGRGRAAAASGPATPDGAGGAPPDPQATATAPLGERRLVVIDCAGGNDGLSMVPPIGSSAYRTLRPRTKLDESTLLPLSATVGMHPSLSRIHARSPAIVQGVGLTRYDLSHFESLRRWWAGDADSQHQSNTGFLGRVCDVIGDATAPAVGLSLGYGPSPALNAASAITMSMDPYSDGRFPTFDDIDMHRAWIAAWRVMAERQSSETVPFCSARDGAAYAKRFSEVARRFPAAGGTYPDIDLGYQLQLAARICAQENGIRVLHVPFYADFDTHDDHLVRHAEVLGNLDQAVDAFMTDLAARGLADKVLVAMTSEFGRRVPDNESNGLDHGSGSFLFLLGPVVGGLHGEYPSLTVLDNDDNLIPTVSMADYYAAIAEDWFGIPAGEVITGGTPLAGLFN